MPGVFTITFDPAVRGYRRGKQYGPVAHPSLEAFVGDDANQLLRCLESPQNLSWQAWPLVLYGPCGSGKTRLCETVASTLLAQRGAGSQRARVWYLSGEEMRSRVVSAMETRSIADFRRQVGALALLLIDDLHGVSPSRETQRELLLLIDDLGQKEIPVLITLRTLPGNCTWMAPALASRLSCGTLLSVDHPGPEARRMLLGQLAGQRSLELTAGALEELSQRITGSVRRLGAALDAIAAKTSTQQADSTIDAAMAARLCGAAAASDSRQLSAIAQVVAKGFHLSPTQLRASRRTQSVSRARGAAMYLSRRLLQLSYQRIGSYFGGRDHSTVRHAVGETGRLIGTDARFAAAVDRLEHAALEQLSQLQTQQAESHVGKTG